MTSLPIVTCDDCGACCLDQSTPPLYVYVASVLASGDAAEIAELEEMDAYAEDVGRVRRLPAEAFGDLLDYAAAGGADSDYGRPCFWYDRRTRRCRWYEHRPTICRDFEAGCVECHEVPRRTAPAGGHRPPAVGSVRTSNVRVA